MISDFASLFAATDPLLDDHFGESFSIAPKVAPSGDINARRVADAARQDVSFVGIWSDPHSRTFPHSKSGHAETLVTPTGDDRPMVDYVTASVGYRARIGDVVTRVATGSRYRVDDIDEDDVTRTTLALTAATKAA